MPTAFLGAIAAMVVFYVLLFTVLLGAINLGEYLYALR